MGNWLLVQADSRRRRNGEQLGVQECGGGKRLGRCNPFPPVQEQPPGRRRYEKSPRVRSRTLGYKSRSSSERLDVAAKAATPWGTSLAKPEIPRSAASFLYVRLRAGPAGAVGYKAQEGFFGVRLGGLLRMTAYGIGDALTCGGWRRGRVRDRGVERADAIARGRMRARSRSCCHTPDTRFSR
jgi:hypothetical protein